MSFQISGLFGTFASIADTIIAIRKCVKEQKKVPALLNESQRRANNIDKALKRLATLVELRSVRINAFGQIVSDFDKIARELKRLQVKLECMNAVKGFVIASESATAVQAINSKLQTLETGIGHCEQNGRTDFKESVNQEVSAAVLDVAGSILVNNSRLERTKNLLNKARVATSTNNLISRVEKVFSLAPESLFLCLMGKIYLDGVNAGVDYEKSRTYFSEAALDYGNAEAFFYLGKIYKKALGVPVDDKKAFKYFHQGAEREHDESLIEIGDCFGEGRGVEKDETKALQSYIPAARKGHRVALREMANCFWYGIGTEVDFAESAHYTRLAASAGDKESLIYVGVNLLYGRGEEKDPKCAVEVFKIAARNGSAEGIVRLADCYYYGNGLPKDMNEAFRYYERAANHQCPLAQAKVGKYLMNGTGVRKNQEAGLKLIRKAARRGSSYAWYVLGFSLQSINSRAAQKLFIDAADRGEKKSHLRLGEIYKRNHQDELAKHHFSIAAKYCHGEAHWELGTIFESNSKGNQDLHQAFLHYQKAAGLNHVKAKEKVFQLGLAVPPRRITFSHKDLAELIRRLRDEYSRKNINLYG